MKLIIKFLEKIIKLCFAYIPLQNVILLESIPDYADNTYPVYLELCRRKEFKEYRLVWAVYGEPPSPNSLDKTSGRTGRVKGNSWLFQWYQLRSKVQVSCNRFLCKKDSRQISLFLTHGSKTKKTRGIYEMGTFVDFINVQSHFFDEMITYEYNCTPTQLVYLGFPRCDWFYGTDQEEIKKKLHLYEREQFFIWLPTFRKHNNGLRIDAQNDLFEHFGIPLIHTETDLRDLNAFLQKQNAHIFFKPHPAQDISSMAEKSFSHIHILHDRDLAALNLQLYQILAASSALITDYSSVFFDYLLLDHPIATTVDDLTQWKEGRGFAFDIEAMHEQATVRVHDIEELQNFIAGVLMGQDEKRSGRNAVKVQTNMYQDGNAAKRVVDFLARQLGAERL